MGQGGPLTHFLRIALTTLEPTSSCWHRDNDTFYEPAHYLDYYGGPVKLGE